MRDKWIGPVYKKLANSELGLAGHTSGIVPGSNIESFFVESISKKTGFIKEILVELHSINKSETFKTNINYHHTNTHNHPHITGNIMPAYLRMGAKKGDVLLFWRNSLNKNRFYAELIKRDDNLVSDFDKIFKNSSGKINVNSFFGGIVGDISNYQSDSIIDSNSFKLEDFKTEKRKNPIKINGKETYPRDKLKGDYALFLADFKCEFDQKHTTFNTKNNKPYMEKHHLIPMKYAREFENNIDDLSNIISLCPICHRKIHYGDKKEILKMLEILWNKREKELSKASININLADLKKMY